METDFLIAVACVLLCYSLVSGLLTDTVFTAPLLFTLVGFCFAVSNADNAYVGISHSTIHVIAEASLVLILFADAARIDLGCVIKDHNLPSRMLLIGLPLIILLGALVATQIFPDFSIWEAALLAALLAPTDAALGQSIVGAKAIPTRIRQAINVESGLNDGVALPAVLLFATLASMFAVTSGAVQWLQFLLSQVMLGALAGGAFGYLGAKLLDISVDRGLMTEAFQGIGILSLAILNYAVVESIGGNGFIAAFIGGMVFGSVLKHPCQFLLEFMETEGQLLMLVTFSVFGAVLLPEAVSHATAIHVLYALLSLTIVRVIPIVLSLTGTGIKLQSKVFLGWFGPRGLASILFVLLILEETNIMHRYEILTVTVITVTLSILLHGWTAAPLAKWMGRNMRELGDCAEKKAVKELPLRGGMIVLHDKI